MPKRNLSIRKNSRSNKNKNKIPKKSKKQVIKKGVKGKKGVNATKKQVKNKKKTQKGGAKNRTVVKQTGIVGLKGKSLAAKKTGENPYFLSPYRIALSQIQLVDNFKNTLKNKTKAQIIAEVIKWEQARNQEKLTAFYQSLLAIRRLAVEKKSRIIELAETGGTFTDQNVAKTGFKLKTLLKSEFPKGKKVQTVPTRLAGKQANKTINDLLSLGASIKPEIITYSETGYSVDALGTTGNLNSQITNGFISREADTDDEDTLQLAWWFFENKDKLFMPIKSISGLRKNTAAEEVSFSPEEEFPHNALPSKMDFEKAHSEGATFGQDFSHNELTEAEVSVFSTSSRNPFVWQNLQKPKLPLLFTGGGKREEINLRGGAFGSDALKELWAAQGMGSVRPFWSDLQRDVLSSNKKKPGGSIILLQQCWAHINTDIINVKYPDGTRMRSILDLLKEVFANFCGTTLDRTMPIPVNDNIDHPVAKLRGGSQTTNNTIYEPIPLSDIVDRIYNYNTDNVRPVCYISFRSGAYISTLEHLFPIMDGLKYGWVCSDFILTNFRDFCENLLGHVVNGETVTQEIINRSNRLFNSLLLLLHPLASQFPNSYKSDQPLFDVVTYQNSNGHIVRREIVVHPNVDTGLEGRNRGTYVDEDGTIGNTWYTVNPNWYRGNRDTMPGMPEFEAKTSGQTDNWGFRHDVRNRFIEALRFTVNTFILPDTLIAPFLNHWNFRGLVPENFNETEISLIETIQDYTDRR